MAGKPKAPAKPRPTKNNKGSTKTVEKRTKAGSGKQAASAKRRIFAAAYLANGGNATKAGLACGLSPATAASAGQRMLHHVEVQGLIRVKQEILAQKYELTAENVIKSLAQAVHFDPRKLYRDDGSMKDIHELDDDTAQAIAGMEVTEEFLSADSEKKRGQDGTLVTGPRVVIGQTKKIKWLDKNTARDQAMKHLGLFEKDNKQRSPLEGISRESLKAIVERLGGKGS